MTHVRISDFLTSIDADNSKILKTVCHIMTVFSGFILYTACCKPDINSDFEEELSLK